MDTVKLSKMTLASAAATILLAGCGADKTAKVEAEAATQVSATVDVKCSGINSCKGTSACATATSACQGQNSCKGQGWIKATKQLCEAKGGKILS